MTDTEREQIRDLVRRKVIQCRMSQTEYEAACEAARKAKLRLSEWLRLIARQNS